MPKLLQTRCPSHRKLCSLYLPARRSGLGRGRRSTRGSHQPEMINVAEKLLKLKQNVLSLIGYLYASRPGFAHGQGAEEVGQGLYPGGLTCFLAPAFGVEDFGAGKDSFPLCVGLGAASYCGSQL